MRRRPGGPIRVLDRCARCGTRYLPNYAGRRVVAHLQTRDGLQRHELIVCRECDVRADPPYMEQFAMSLDGHHPLHFSVFAQHFGQDLLRVQRTAEYFLGADRYAELRPQLVAAREEREAAIEDRDAEYAWLERNSYLDDDDEKEADDLPF